MPDEGPLVRLIERLRRLIESATGALETVYPRGVGQWETELTKALKEYHAAAYLAGSGEKTLAGPAKVAVQRDIATQLAFLRKFGVAIRGGKRWENGWNARAQMYAGGIQTPYWRGKTKMLPLPAMPGEGSQCLTNCRCSWVVSTVNEENNDYDCTWVYGDTDQHCQTCKEREAAWAPLRIRGGVVQ